MDIYKCPKSIFRNYFWVKKLHILYILSIFLLKEPMGSHERLFLVFVLTTRLVLWVLPRFLVAPPANRRDG